jgi:hypothetical protein
MMQKVNRWDTESLHGDPERTIPKMIEKMISTIARARTFVAMLVGLDIQTPWESVPVIHPANVEKYPDVDSSKSTREGTPQSTRSPAKKPVIAPASELAASQRAAFKRAAG